MMKKGRITYAILFVALLFIEICIALFVHDRFVRPYIGDALVTVLLCCLWRVAVPKSVPALPVYVFIFAALVELAQYVDVVALLGWEIMPFFPPSSEGHFPGRISFVTVPAASAFGPRKKRPFGGESSAAAHSSL